jgi:hypothetical protein
MSLRFLAPLSALACALAVAACSGVADEGPGASDTDADPGEVLPFPDAPAGDAGDDAPSACAVNGVSGSCLDVSDCLAPLTAVPGHCPGPTNIQCCVPAEAVGDGGTSDASTWCPTDPAARPNEGLKEEPGATGCPAGMIRSATACVDRFEASIVIVQSDGSTKSWSPYYSPPSSQTFKAVSLRGAVPQAYISGNDAKKACENAGKRLCTSDEWLRACQGPSGFTYPYGDARQPGVCNDARIPHPAVQCFDTEASWIYSELSWPGIDQQPMTVDRTGANAGCVSADGAYDMMGNLHEWVYDGATTHTFRGGYYVDTIKNGNGCLYRTTAHALTYSDYSTGFRCCADPI